MMDYEAKEDVKDIPVSTNLCPMECGGLLTKAYKINSEPQYAISCTKCNWWVLI